MFIIPISATPYTYPVASIKPIRPSVNAVSKITGANPIGLKDNISVGQVKPSNYQTCKSRNNIHRTDNNNVKFSVCMECGTPFAEGGTTRTILKYNLSNPYEKEKKSIDASLLVGANFDTLA